MTHYDNSRLSTSKLINRDASVSRTAGSEDYYGGSSAAVPFKWESQPGTPNRLFRDSLPIPTTPLTPPPSYFNACSSPKSINPKLNTLLGSVLRMNRSRRASAPSSPACSSSSSSSSSSESLSSSPPSSSEFRGVNRIPNRRMSFGYGSNHNKTGGCYALIVKVLLRDAK